jgi:HEAT repeat protein
MTYGMQSESSSDEGDLADSASLRNSPGISPDELLPPVEPPNPAFILQLFVVPGVIVLIIVAVWLAFNWLAQMGSDPLEYVRAIERNNQGRWQAAVNLANALNNERGPQYQELRQNREVVARLAEILENEIREGRPDDENSITFKYYLCKTLGAFAVPEALPALIEASRTARDPKENEVRRGALEAIALLAENVRKADAEPLGGSELENALREAAGDDDPLVRSSAAYAMGVVASEPTLKKLRGMLGDGYPDVRFNAATGLARHGDAAAAEVLIEMLDPEAAEGVKVEKEAPSRDFKRGLIQVNGLRAIEQLLKANPQIDGQQFVAPIETLRQSKLPQQVDIEAVNVLRIAKERG